MTKQAASTASKAKLVSDPENPGSKRVYSLEYYLQKEANARRKHEFYNGQIVPMPYAKAPHNLIAANIITALNIAIDQAGKDYVVLSGDQKVYFPELNTGVYADVLVVCEKMEFYDKQQLLLINPILAVEILSRSTRYYDRHGKFDLYKTLPDFQEYMLVEQDSVHIETRYQTEPNLWRYQTETRPDGIVQLDALGLQIAVKDIYKRVNLVL